MDCLRDNWKGAVLDGRFELVSPLNHGSFGMVTLGKDLVTGENVAVKCMTKSASSCSGLLVDERSEELASHLALGEHPHVVSLISSFETDAHIFLVLEYCSMGDLYEAIRSGRGPKETHNVREFMMQLVDAVEYAHSKGIAHRDIKPENIFLTANGDLKLGDFGLSTREAWSYESAVGSDRYMSPEQYDCSDAGYSSMHADIWAVGVCLLNLLFSRNPFAVPNESDPLFVDYTRDRQSLFDVFPTMSQDTFEVLSHAMALDPEKRSLAAVRAALERVISFTTDDDEDDEFCVETPSAVPARANREPLRTPSITTPHLAPGQSFPWAEALYKSPQPFVRELSNISDQASYSEDLFPASERIDSDWVSVSPETPSADSILSAAFETTFRKDVFRSAPLNIAASAPAPPLPSLAAVFGGKREEFVSKSWSDLFDDEQEEAELEAERERDDAISKRRAQNARSWSQESADERTVRLDSIQASVPWRSRRNSLKQTINENDGFLFEEHATPARPAYTPAKTDKWRALGELRRAYASPPSSNRPSTAKPTRQAAVPTFTSMPAHACAPKTTFWRKPFDALGDVEWANNWSWSDLRF